MRKSGTEEVANGENRKSQDLKLETIGDWQEWECSWSTMSENESGKRRIWRGRQRPDFIANLYVIALVERVG